jgi:hypothetical protein
MSYWRLLLPSQRRVPWPEKKIPSSLHFPFLNAGCRNTIPFSLAAVRFESQWFVGQFYSELIREAKIGTRLM